VILINPREAACGPFFSRVRCHVCARNSCGFGVYPGLTDTLPHDTAPACGGSASRRARQQIQFKYADDAKLSALFRRKDETVR